MTIITGLLDTEFIKNAISQTEGVNQLTDAGKLTVSIQKYPNTR